MRIACLQFAPQVGDVDNNLNRADAVLSRANPQDIDLLVLPELAFSGYNFKSLHQISPYLEPTTSGITSLWARTTALKYNCVVVAGYPEKVDMTPKWPTSPEYYNSAITVNAEGETIANYRKSFLHYTDETWALEGPDGFYDDEIEGLGTVAMGICMDLNPYKFEAPWNAWEFANHILLRRANLVVLSLAWMTRDDPRAFSRTPKEPDMDTLAYWLMRLEPLIRNEGEDEIIVVFANRTGLEGDATYAGTSAVLGIRGGEVRVYGVLGRGERELLVIDTSIRPKMQLICEPRMPKAPESAKAAAAVSSTSSDLIGDSDVSLTSEASTTSSHSSLDAPPLTPCLFSAMADAFPLDIHPKDDTPQDDISLDELPLGDFPIKYVTDKFPSPFPAPEPKERKPTPIPVPSVYSRPPSPKSRNCSRSRVAGTERIDSPVLGRMLGNIITDEERPRDSPLLRGIIDEVRRNRADYTFTPPPDGDESTHTTTTPLEAPSPTSPTSPTFLHYEEDGSGSPILGGTVEVVISSELELQCAEFSDSDSDDDEQEIHSVECTYADSMVPRSLDHELPLPIRKMVDDLVKKEILLLEARVAGINLNECRVASSDIMDLDEPEGRPARGLSMEVAEKEADHIERKKYQALSPTIVSVAPDPADPFIPTRGAVGHIFNQIDVQISSNPIAEADSAVTELPSYVERNLSPPPPPPAPRRPRAVSLCRDNHEHVHSRPSSAIGTELPAYEDQYGSPPPPPRAPRRPREVSMCRHDHEQTHSIQSPDVELVESEDLAYLERYTSPPPSPADCLSRKIVVDMPTSEARPTRADFRNTQPPSIPLTACDPIPKSPAGFNHNRGFQTVSLDRAQNRSRADADKTHYMPPSSDDAEEGSSFTKNFLGPLSRHI
ncbi:hypothetical protein IFR05_003903, partial [Cadophora sp. M221]